MPTRSFARGALRVPAIGFGAGVLSDPGLSEAAVDGLLGAAFDLGVRLFDTAPSYGPSEARIARFLKGRRDAIVLSTKVGYGVEGVTDWTPEAVQKGVDLALERFDTDYIDIVHLHSCPTELLEQGEVPAALTEAVRAGKVRIAAYSGDGHALYVSTRLEGFAGVQASLSIADRNNAPTVTIAKHERGYGTIAKRALANAPWRFAARPEREDEAEYFDRWAALAFALEPHDPAEICIRWVTHHTDTDCTLIGTRSPDRLVQAVAAIAEGPLPRSLLLHLDARWDEIGAYWPPLV